MKIDARIWIVLLSCGACQGADSDPPGEAPAGDAASVAATAPPPMAASETRPASWGLGSHDVEAFVAAWDLDVSPDGRGLPPGQGTAEDGAPLYQSLCASCHGVQGEGMSINPRVVAVGTEEEQFRARGIGQFWPYSTTLYDYIRRSMPQTAPGSLEPDQIYALVAWLLAENGRIGPTEVMNAQTLPAVEMPGRARFVADDRVPGPVVR